jgi:hypothetical protein
MTCAVGSYCAGANGTCVVKRALGATCTTGNECVNGFCTDGVCCATACDESCRRCNAPGKLGTCDLLESGRDSTAAMPCVAPRRCNTGGICR